MMNAQKNLVESLKWRYAARKFLPRKVSEQDLAYILEAGNLMPTSYGLQPFRFVVVDNNEIKESLVEHAYGQRHVADNSHLVVICARTDIDEAMIGEYAARLVATRGQPVEMIGTIKATMGNDLTKRTPEARLEWAKKQAYIALGGMFAAASEKGIDNHSLEGFNPAKFNEILGLTKRHLHAAVLFIIGYRSESDPALQNYKKVRVALSEMVIRV